MSATAVLETAMPLALRAALAYAKDGYYPFPWSIEEKKGGKLTKLPSVKGWELSQAPTEPPDVDQLQRWFGDGRKFARHNIGYATGWRWNYAQGCAVPFAAVDVDVNNGKPGEASWAKLLADHQLTDNDVATLTAQSWSGGKHYVFHTAKPLKSDAGHLVGYPGIDVRSQGGWLAVYPSVVQGKPYTWVDARIEPIQMPAALEAVLPQAGAPRSSVDRTPVPSVDPDRAAARAVEYLKTAPVSIEGQGGDTTAYKVAAKLKDMDCTADVAGRLMLDHWNDRCQPPWDWAELAVKVSNAYGYGKEPQGSTAPEKAFDKVPAPDSGDHDADHPLAVLNRTHAFVLIGGAGYVLWETTDDRGTPCVEFLQLTTFHQLMAAKTLQTGKRSEPLTQAWMAWPQRRTYRGVTFAPGRDLPAGYFNLWRGFGVTPKLGDWSLMRAHIRKVVCGGDPLLDHYVMGWLARMVQQPGERGEVALVLRGAKGTGKGTLGDWLLRIFGRHGTHIVNAKHLVGNFNRHLQEAAFLFADEAFWAGDKQHEGVLKALITERTLMIEAKGKDAVPRDNCLHILMASNSDWVVPASAEERRYCVVDVSDVKMQDHAYFSKLAKQRDAGGLAAMLFDLQRYDLTGFQVREVPSTKALGDQKLHCLTGAARWLYDVLSRSEVDSTFRWGDGELAVQKTHAFNDYCQRSQRLYREHHPQDEREFWKQVRAMMKGTAFRDVRLSGGDGRPRAAVFPALAEARAAFARYMRSDLDWSQGQDDADLNTLLS